MPHPFHQDISFQNSLLEKKVNDCRLHIDFISCDQIRSTSGKQSSRKWSVLKAIQTQWRIICGSGKSDITAQKKAWNTIDQIGSSISPHDLPIDSLLRTYHEENETGNRFFILLTGYEPDGIPKFELNFLCNLEQLQKGCLPMHAAGVIHQRQLLLFAGRSGAGKSTISKLLTNPNDRLLDEDQVLLYPLSDRIYSAHAWGYSLKKCRTPVRGIFHIIQSKSNTDSIKRLTQAQTTKVIVEQVGQAVVNMIPSERIPFVFKQAATIARNVPGYELHFRKNLEFWRLVDRHLAKL